MNEMTRRGALASAVAGIAMGSVALNSTVASAAEASSKEEPAEKKKVREEALFVKKWNYTTRNTAQEAVAFVNAPTAQVAGEALISQRADGKYDIFYFL